MEVIKALKKRRKQVSKDDSYTLNMVYFNEEAVSVTSVRDVLFKVSIADGVGVLVVKLIASKRERLNLNTGDSGIVSELRLFGVQVEKENSITSEVFTVVCYRDETMIIKADRLVLIVLRVF